MYERGNFLEAFLSMSSNHHGCMMASVVVNIKATTDASGVTTTINLDIRLAHT
eukprot:m.432578 g.432578  ORF g.432578 m.432578 type:complete len:53 (+) comp21410_c0_seq3:39-197(+)